MITIDAGTWIGPFRVPDTSLTLRGLGEVVLEGDGLEAAISAPRAPALTLSDLIIDGNGRVGLLAGADGAPGVEREDAWER